MNISFINISFAEPRLLLLLVLPLGTFLLHLIRAFRIREKGAFHASLYGVLALVFLTLVIAGPRASNESTLKKLTALVDVSRSIDPQDGEAMLTLLRDISSHSGLEVSVIPFAAHAAASAEMFSSIGNYAALRQRYTALDQTNSDLQAAVQEGIHEGTPLVLLSDGYQTKGDVFAALDQLQQNPLYSIVPAEIHSLRERAFSISRLDVPLVAAMQAAAPIVVSITNSTESPQSGMLSVFHDSHQVSATHVQLNAGEESVLRAESDASLDGIRKIEATLVPDSPALPKVNRIAYLAAQKREKLLLVSGAAEDKRMILDALTGQAYQVQEVTAAPKIESLPALKDFSAVILNNTALSQLPVGSATQLRQYVEQGGGFIAIGGNRGFGLGGYIGSQLEDVFPVQLLPPQSEQKRLNVAVELVIDKSQSMRDDQKMEFAKEAAREVIRNLKDEDFVGIIGFDRNPFEVVKLARLSENRALALDRVVHLVPVGGTNLFPAMDEGRQRLEGVQAGRKHMIVLTDGKLPDADMTYVTLVKEMRTLGLSVSTILVGTEFDFGFLKQLADFGGGSYYQTADPSSLPRIFMQDVKIRSGERTLKEQQRFFVKNGPQIGSLLQPDDYPDLLGFVETKPKAAAKVDLTVSGSEGGYPLLASGTFGSGKTAAFTSDANGRWSRDWIVWTKFVPFWTKIINSVRTLSEQSGKDMHFDVRWSAQGNSLMLDVSLFSDPAEQAVTLAVKRPKGADATVALTQISKGRYQGRLNQISAGKYELKINVGRNALTPVAIEVEPSALGEQEHQGFNIPLLEELARLSGGKLNPSADELHSKPYSRVEYRDLTAIPLALALVFLLLEILTRNAALRFFRSGNFSGIQRNSIARGGKK